jgi:4-amino-4-deoxychorismate lyase
MCHLFETICLLDGNWQNIENHLLRIQKAKTEIPELVLPEISEIIIPQEFTKGKVRCRIDYGCMPEDIKISFSKYKPRLIQSLKIVDNEYIDYHLKYSDRSIFEQLLLQKEDADEILIVQNGLVTDTSFTNIIFSDGKLLVTPRKPLLAGTQRQALLQNNMITEADIYVDYISNFQFIILINAMLGINDGPRIPVSAIRGI